VVLLNHHLKNKLKKRKRKEQKQNQKQKQTNEQKEDIEEDTEDEDVEFSVDASLCLRIMDEDDPIGILYETNGIVVKACVTSKINNEETTEI
jgi:hypothetical protein